MKIKLLSCVLILLLASPLMALPREDGSRAAAPSSMQVDNDTYINANLILMFVTNHGNFGRDLSDVFGYDYGTFFPYTAVADISSGANVTSPNYASGLWVGGVDAATGDTLIALSEYSSEYVPGPMAGGTFQADVPAFRVYKLRSDSLGHPNPIYNDPDTGFTPNAEWDAYMADAIAQGAPNPWTIDTTYEADSVTIASIDTVPDILGDQFLWSVFNDADPAQHDNDAGETAPLGIEVKQSVFAFRRVDPLGNIVFFRLRVFNNGTKTLNNTYFSLWADPDLGGAGDDLVGCDTALSLGYVYNDNNADQQYGSRPPAMGFDFFQGPLVESPGDTGKMWDGKLWPDSANLGMVSFNKYINGTDPDSYVETYGFMNGLTKQGVPYVYNGDTSLYVHTGDPVTGTGDLDIAPADRRWMQSTGPITFAPGDSTEIIAAIIVGQGGDRLSSISVMKYFDQFAQSAYNVDFDIPEPPAIPVVNVGEFDGELALTWTKRSENDPGDYPFQGYSIFQGETASGPWTLIGNYDVIDGIAQIQDDVLDPLTGALERRLVKQGTDNGIVRYFIVDRDFINGGDLRNLTTYFFRVEAYSYDATETPVTLTSSTDPIQLTPQNRPADYDVTAPIGSDFDVTHVSGASGGVVTVEVVDPLSVTGDDYRVFFRDTLGIVVDTVIDLTVDPPDTTFDSTNVAWFLQNATTGDTLLAWQTNQSGDDNYEVIDGMVIRVSGPPPGFGSFQVVANGAGPVDPPVPGAFAFQSFPTPDAANPGADQQVGDGLWGVHTADNGGTCGGGTRGSYDAFLSRGTRDGANNALIGAYDFEMRFTGDTTNPGTDGSYAIEWFNDDNVFWVPFELWRTGIGTPNDPSDDVRLVPFIIDDGNDDTYNLESWGCVTGTFGGDGEHSASGADNDPFTDWVYWMLPTDETPGEAGYLANETMMLGGGYDASLISAEILARTVLVNWNGGDAPPFTQGLPELGTVIRLVTEKPNAPADTFSFVSEDLAAAAKNQAALDAIKAVPNPFYLYSDYDPSPGNKQLKFSNLPEKCTIQIFNLGGTLVRTIEKDDASTSIATWNLLTENGLPVASGIYIYVVDAPGFGQKIGKMAIFVESEVLQLY